jgi:DNA ligase D-like protein (predicted ligase)
MTASQTKARFIDPMLLLRNEKLPEGANWQYEVKLDGYRAIAFNSGGQVHLRSRNDKDFNQRYPAIVKALSAMPDETVIDGEVVALDESGRPDFNALQNYGSSKTPILYYVFDSLIIAGREVMSEPLRRRRELLHERVLSRLGEPIRESPVLEARLPDLIASVKAQGLEGLVAKRLDSRYEPGQRSGAWQKMRVNQGQEFVIGGYTPAGRNFDAIIFGYYDDQDRLLYVGRTRNGFTPATREDLYKRFRGLETAQCPFLNLPEARSGRWGEGLTAEKMKECHWLKPALRPPYLAAAANSGTFRIHRVSESSRSLASLSRSGPIPDSAPIPSGKIACLQNSFKILTIVSTSEKSIVSPFDILRCNMPAFRSTLTTWKARAARARKRRAH